MIDIPIQCLTSITELYDVKDRHLLPERALYTQNAARKYKSHYGGKLEIRRNSDCHLHYDWI